MPTYLFNHLNEFEDFRKDEKTAVITDIDGTISKIVLDPYEATISQIMKTTLKKLVNKFQLVGIVTGRNVKNAKEMLEVDGLLYIGSHGLEYLKNDEIYIEPEVEKYLPLIQKVAQNIQTEEELYNIKNILFQEKGLCFTVHYRKCEDPEGTRRKILDAINELEELEKFKVTEGRKVVEIRPKIGHDKGTILEKLIFENAIEKIIYLGDDVTDVDAFNKLKELKGENKVNGLGIVVISEEVPEFVRENASFYVNGVEEVQKFFNWLLKS
ncbi:trehalose-phosphatase [Methanobacterium sp.]|uniref:trehalose-phosphatase n=1 Tax=Methanobacterium sp. TaxID=2164 RepID=UPI003C71C16A